MYYDRTNQAILAVSFGTSFNGNRSITIGAIESTLAECFPEYTVRRAFTSGMIAAKLLKRDGIVIDNVEQALDKLEKEGFLRVIIQPTTLLEGDEYSIISEISKRFEDRFVEIKIGHSLLGTEEDIEKMAEVLDRITKDYDAEDTARVFMGHGTEHGANSVYGILQKAVNSKGIRNLFIGTVEASPNVEDMIDLAKKSGCKKAVLTPLMIVAGDHANNDMAGKDDSWKTKFEEAGFEVCCRLVGLGSEYEIQKMIADNCRELLPKEE